MSTPERPRYKRKFGGFVLPKWNDAQTAKFFRLYEKHRCLWDMRDPDYRNMEVRAQAYQDMVLKMGMNCSEEIIKRKIKNIRTIYARELKEVKRTRKAGCPDRAYVPTLSWYHEADRFLRNIVSERPCRHDEDDQTQEATEHQEESMDDGQGDCLPSELLEGEMIEEEDELEEYEPAMRQQTPLRLGSSLSHHSHGIRSQRRSKLHPRRGPSRLARPSSSTVAQKALSRISQITNTSNQMDDEFAMFGKLVSSQLRSMPLERAIVAQSKILTLLTEERVQWLSEVEQEKHVSTIVHIGGDGHEYMELHQEESQEHEEQEETSQL
nr:PREDICTED: uncharacterized protein LOC109044054 [Bemisia tabaci]